MPLFTLLLLALAGQQTATDLGEITVVAQPLDPLVSVTVSGDIPATALVRSDPVGVRCGLTQYQYDAYASPRLCWVRQPVGTPIQLSAEGANGLTVQWNGCTPSADGRACTLATPSHGASVTATFVRR